MTLGYVSPPAYPGDTKDVSLLAGIQERTGESKGKSEHDLPSQTEMLPKGSGWTNEDGGSISKANYSVWLFSV